ncbi:methionyl-tRNA formyltransferase [Succinatimonas hippei]|uniref:Methionyl-tRNA formyltransferase n=1 Tax=Succinatimonas hippei (strain DSM 22608 / JCM 16073 / KCTC 15190 / YIT 12066) TaxID=762983 RepID=E8LHD7_SUCHY|nr:methionyl-tRNA formyltransferase [Succinatimonas hippei]EFY08045.1 methionyl-tRNA formyltransferase [Succinatimonas hippei YIT 12066]MDM8120185.1 methionyl-tRNA formyltransferase [Succinatimonas hippei]
MSKIIFAGTPDFAAVHLKALIDAGIIPCAVYTQPDRPAGRGHKLTPSPVKELALLHNIEVLTPENFKNKEDVDKFLSFNADLAIVVAYGVILPDSIVHGPKLGCINVHGSLLPAYRGAAPIQRALLDGNDRTGVTIMKIVKELDAGDMLIKAEIPISADDTSGSLFDKLASLGAKTLVDNLPDILAEKITAKKQDPSLATYAKKITKEEARLNFNDSAENCNLKIRGLNPWPIANASIDNIVFKIFKAKVLNDNQGKEPGTIISVDKKGISVACAEGAVCLEIIQAPGKGRVNAADFARSRSDIFSVGKKFE